MTQGNPKFFPPPPTLNFYIVLNVMLLSKNERIMCKRKEQINTTKAKVNAIKDRMMESRKVQI